ncbi:DNA/RNA-binding domain [Macleaya cordata]|uniref:DNA/RNA-binding domain n=1 Tax=Macleaya cordata TaxID=56857 RepID=A0A200R706_MACCD|nr:DNA/RNA-binding domain [Macleaya cordata]
MTVPMDNSAPSSRELVQRLFNKNVELENRRRKSAQARIPSDPNAWQQMRENYEAIILEDHAFSELHEIEYALWQLHYRRIEELRAHFSAALASTGATTSPGGKSPARPDRIKKIRSQFKTFLSEATGFYHELILKIRAKYGLPLGYFSEDQENQNILSKDGKKSTETKKGLISCHRCLIYLGDLARYKGLYGEGDSKTRDYAAASSYYLQAASLWPSSGNPHHQLAILASYSGDDLLAVYRYFRSLATDNPFSTARDNLIIAFEKNRQSYSQFPGYAKASSVRTAPVRNTANGRGKGEKIHPSKGSVVETNSTKERAVCTSETYKSFCVRFVRLNGILFTRTSLETFGEVFSSVSGNLQELLSSGPEEELNFGSDAAENGLVIVRLIAILIFTVHNVNREAEGLSYAEILQRSVLLQNAYTVTFEFVGCILERCVQLHDPSSSYLLPGILIFVEWLACRPDIAAGSDLEEKQATARSFFWNQCISLLNKLLLTGSVSCNDDEDEMCFFNMSRYDEGETGNRLALWEDFELRGFLPLLPAQLILDFSRKQHPTGSDGGSPGKRVRAQRIVAAGKALVNVVQINHQGIYFDQKLKKFVIGVEPQTPEDSLVATSDMPKSHGLMQGNPIDKTNKIVVQQNSKLYVEVEEEDEVIVFKPTVTEKPIDVVAPNLSAYEAHGPGENVLKVQWASYVETSTDPLCSLSLQHSSDACIQLPAYANIVPKHPQTINPSIPKWHADQQDFFANEMKNLSVVEDGLVVNAKLREALNATLPPVFSHSVPQNAINIASGMFSDQSKASEAVVPSKFDSIISSGLNAESLTMKPSAALQANLRKSPVSRPVRHPGPPPGFSFPPKPVDEPVTGSHLKNEIPLLDDYRWLDEYQLSSSTNTMVPSNSVKGTPHVYPHAISNISSLTGSTSFPFPGKQGAAMPVEVEGGKNWQDYQLFEHLKLYQQTHHQLQQANQDSVTLAEQYQGQPLWSGRFFV